MQKLHFNPNLLGFENLLDVVNTRHQPTPKYPPHNIRQHDDNYVIEVATAGMSMDHIQITQEDRSLGITYMKRDIDEGGWEYTQRGISDKDWQLQFTLSDTMEVVDADMDNGLLTVNLVNKIPEEKKPRKIPISKIGNKEFLTEDSG